MQNKLKKEKNYHVLRVNCDCSLHLEARASLKTGPWNNIKCRICGKDCGIMEWKIIGKVKALGDLDAINKYSQEKEIHAAKNNT